MSTESSDDAIGADDDAGGATAGGTERGIGDVLGEETAQQYVKYNVGVFGAIGVGFALALVLMDALSGSGGVGASLGLGGGQLAVIGLFLVFFLSPLIGGVTGTLTSLHYDDEEKAVATVAGAGAFLGYIAVLVLIIVTAAVVGGSGGGGGGSSSFTNSIGALLGYGVGVGVAGAAAAVVTERFT